VTKDTAFLGAFGKLGKATTNFVMSFVLSVRTEKLGSTGRIFMKFAISMVVENLSRKCKFHSDLTRITGTLHEDVRKFFIISLSVLLGMKIFGQNL
jgi:hypothetical protein